MNGGALQELEIRVATPQDATGLGELARRAVAQRSRTVYTPDQVASAAACITAPDLDLIRDGTLFAAVMGARIVGCGGWSKRKKLYTGSDPADCESQFLDPTSEPARIRAFFVDKEMSGRGVGKAIYERCREDAMQAGFQRFELIATLPGIPFYRSLGFTVDEDTEILLVDGTRLPVAKMSMELNA